MTPHPTIVLSTGRTITHEPHECGGQRALVDGNPDLAMTDAEWTEYCAKLKDSAPLSPRAQRVLDIFCAYKSGYREKELAEPYDPETVIVGADDHGNKTYKIVCRQPGIVGIELEGRISDLVKSGHLTRNKIGSVSVTPKGKAARSKRLCP